MHLRNDRIARVSRAGERVLAIANFPQGPFIVDDNGNQTKDRFGATPKPARETRALPRIRKHARGITPPSVGVIVLARTRDLASQSNWR